MFLLGSEENLSEFRGDGQGPNSDGMDNGRDALPPSDLGVSMCGMCGNMDIPFADRTPA